MDAPTTNGNGNGKETAPAYQWYVKDWRSSSHVLRMTWEQQGIYRFLLDQQWLDGSIPRDHGELARMVNLSLRRFEIVWPRILECFTATEGGRLINERLAQVRALRNEYIAKQPGNGKLGGPGHQA